MATALFLSANLRSETESAPVNRSPRKNRLLSFTNLQRLALPRLERMLETLSSVNPADDDQTRVAWAQLATLLVP